MLIGRDLTACVLEAQRKRKERTKIGEMESQEKSSNYLADLRKPAYRGGLQMEEVCKKQLTQIAEPETRSRETAHSPSRDSPSLLLSPPAPHVATRGVCLSASSNLNHKGESEAVSST